MLLCHTQNVYLDALRTAWNVQFGPSWKSTWQRGEKQPPTNLRTRPATCLTNARTRTWPDRTCSDSPDIQSMQVRVVHVVTTKCSAIPHPRTLLNFLLGFRFWLPSPAMFHSPAVQIAAAALASVAILASRATAGPSVEARNGIAFQASLITQFAIA